MYSVVVPQVSSSGTSDASNKSIASSSGGGGMGYQVFKKGIQNLNRPGQKSTYSREIIIFCDIVPSHQKFCRILENNVFLTYWLWKSDFGALWWLGTKGNNFLWVYWVGCDLFGSLQRDFSKNIYFERELKWPRKLTKSSPSIWHLLHNAKKTVQWRFFQLLWPS